MRQGNGAELLGASDPRSATIGIIYVAPTDDRQSVLTAISTQEKLGRKQVAIVLPDQNKAFQQAVDFDSLKNIRNRLQAQIIFVAASGFGPAELARHRRFPVFSSLENYKKYLQDENQAEAGSRKSWAFGRKSQPGDSNPARKANDARPADAQPPVVIYPVVMPSNTSGKENPLPLSANLPTNNPAEVDRGISMKNTPIDEDEEDVAPNAQDDIDDLPLPTAGIAPDIQSSNIPPKADQGGKKSTSGPIAQPGIISLVPRNTGKLPVTAAPSGSTNMPTQPLPTSTTPASSRNTGKMAAINPATGTNTVVTHAANPGAPTSTVGNTPQNMGNSGRRRSNIGKPSRSRGGFRLWILALVILLLLSVGLCGGIAIAKPSLLSPIAGIIPAVPGASPSATVNIKPTSNDLKNTYLISAVTGTPNATQRQVQARLVTANTASQPKTVPATGTGAIPATQATGQLIFSNGNGSSYSVAANTVFTDSRGVQIANDGLVIIPPSNPPNFGRITVNAHAVTSGTRGNIPAGDFNNFNCCGSSAVFVTSLAFTGGQDPQNYTVVQQSDIDGVANPLVKSLTDSTKADVQKQINTKSERLISDITCTSDITTDNKVGDKATSVTVSVKVTCNGEVYDQQGALTMASNLLTSDAKTNADLQGYVLAGSVVTAITQSTLLDTQQGTISLQVKAEGIWFYQFTDALKQNLAKQIAGKAKKSALDLLTGQTGVAKVDIQISGSDPNTLPTDVHQITFNIENITGLQGTPGATPTKGASPTSGTSTGSPTVPVSSPTQTQTTGTPSTTATPTSISANG